MADAKDTKSCPWCGEEIKIKALLCRFCHNDVTERGQEAARKFASGETDIPFHPPGAEQAPPRPAAEQSGSGLSRLSKFVPESLLQGLVDSAEDIDEGERRPITVLFSDLAGFTSLTEKIGAEAMSELLDEIYAHTREVVSKYDGLVDKFIGDASMVLFGAHVAHGDDPERAIRAALDIREAVRMVGRSYGYDLDTHCGVAYGEVIFKTMAGEGRLDFHTIGDAVNLASRLEGAAQRGETLVDHRIYRQTRNLFEWEHRDPIKVKGKQKPVQIHRVLGIYKHYAKVVLDDREDLAPMVGRVKELKLLEAAAFRAGEGHSCEVVIKAERGVGKSRLIQELYRKLPPEAFHWFLGRCQSFGASIPFLPFINLLRSVFDFHQEGENLVTPDDLKDAVESIYEPARSQTRSTTVRRDLDRRSANALAAAGLLFSVADSNNPLLKLSPKERREQIFASIVDMLKQLAKEKPAIVVFEDFHWADPDSMEMLDRVMIELRKSAILLIIVTRPELQRVFALQDDAVGIELRELSAKESEELLRRLLGIDRLPKGLLSKIIEKTEGNPFYIEEVVGALEEEGQIERKDDAIKLKCKVGDIQIPDSVEGVVLARYDQLERAVKRVMQVASVVGQEFRYQTLTHVDDVRNRLRDHMFKLVDGNYVLQRTLMPELVYIFRHIVLRDVAYGTMLEKRRRHFHARVAMALEDIFSDHTEEFVELLAHHFERGRIDDKAIEYLERAAVKCERLYANYAAADHWERLLGVLAQCDWDFEDIQPVRLKANLRLEELCRLLGRPKRAIQANKEALSDARSLEDKPKAIEALYGMSEACRLAGQTDKGAEALQEAVRLARKSRDPKLLMVCYNYLGHFERMRGNYKKANGAFKEVLRLAEETGDRMRKFQALNHLGILFMFKGETSKANAYYHDALELAKELGLQREQVQISLNLGINQLRLGQCDKAADTLASAATHAEKIESERGVQLVMLALSDVHLKSGDWRRAATTSRQLLRRAIDAEFNDVKAVALTNQARANVALGKLDHAEKNIEEVMEMVEADDNYVGRLDALSVKTEILLHHQLNRQALETAEEMLALVKRRNDDEWIPMAYTLCARAKLALNQTAAARRQARLAVEASRKANLPRDEGWAQLTLSLCEQALKNKRGFRTALDAAGRIAKKIQDMALADRIQSARATA